MGADLLLLVVPKAKITQERRKDIDYAMSLWTMGNVDVQELVDHEMLDELNDQEHEDDVLSDVKRIVKNALEEYKRFGDRRDVTSMRLAPDMEHYAAGGSSWGESPSEAFEIMSTLVTFSDIYSLLEEWAREDHLNNPKNRERFKKWCKTHCQIRDVA